MTHWPADPASQSASALQWHANDWQVNPAGHCFPQAPQFCASAARLKQPEGPWQQVCPLAHAAAPLHEHASLTHVSPRAHRSPLQLQRPRLHVPLPPQALPTHMQLPPPQLKDAGQALSQPPQ